MANKSVFASTFGKLLPATDAVNRSGAPAYRLSPRDALAQLAVTGCFNGTFYASAGEQLDETLRLAKACDPEFVAKTAVYARRAGMKDMPALLAAHLCVARGGEVQAPSVMGATFASVIDNGKMLRTFVQMLRSGVVGRKSLGTAPKRLVQRWLVGASDAQIIRAMVGTSPSLADVIKMVHPKPDTAERDAFFAYVLGKDHDAGLLPEAIRAFEAFKADRTQPVPDVPFQMLTALELEATHWLQLARRGGWHFVRMNIATFQRRGVFELDGATAMIAERLIDSEAIARSRVMPYQVMTSWTAAKNCGAPREIVDALEIAMDIALANVPRLDGLNIAICPDVSGSMGSPVTGFRRGSTTAVRCVDVAALFATALMRANPTARVLPFDTEVRTLGLTPDASVMDNAQVLADAWGGGTSCGAPVAELIAQRRPVDLVVMISDNESWISADGSQRYGRGTDLMAQWQKLKARNPGAKLICWDIQPYTAVQAVNRADILNVGGVSDKVFDAIAAFAKGPTGSFADIIEATPIMRH